MQEQTKTVKNKKRCSLSFILWISFFCFSLVTIVLFGVFEVKILQQSSREKTIQNLNNAVEEIKKDLSIVAGPNGVPLGFFLFSISENYDVNVRIVSQNGVLLFPRVEDIEEGENAEYSDEELETMNSNVGTIYQVNNDLYAYVDIIIYNKGEAFLYVSDSYTIESETLNLIIFQTGYMAAIMLIIASVLSGAISMYVSRPIAVLNQKAQRMSLGNMHIDFTQEGGIAYREIAELSNSLNYAESEILKTDLMQKELIANVSHDFKTPLTMIKAYASMIKEISGDNPEKREKHAQVIIDEADRLTALVNDMLDLSKLQAGMGGLQLTLFNLSDYVLEIAERFNYLKESADYSFVLDVQEGLYVEADKAKIGQVLYNLIGNAVNYTGQDKTVFIRLYSENGVHRFSVTDTGVGIAPEELDTIWDRYYRSKEMHKRPVKGTGLGLSIVKTCLVQHKFDFGVKSELGKGSTFYVNFPVKNVLEF